VIKLFDIWKVYRQASPVEALRGVALEVERGDYLAITGPSGSGKSTLMHIIGFLDTPTQGEYYFEGRPVSALIDEELAQMRRQEVGFVFQEFNLLPRLSALENVALPLSYTRIARKFRLKQAMEVLTAVGLRERAGHRPNELSGGECQRVAIARALVNSPKILLADEPTGNLDSRTGAEIMAIFDSLAQKGVTIIVVTHDPEVATHTRRVLRLKDGVIE
jgi:putative ABC transport system ATP-binding protein